MDFVGTRDRESGHNYDHVHQDFDQTIIHVMESMQDASVCVIWPTQEKKMVFHNRWQEILQRDYTKIKPKRANQNEFVLNGDNFCHIHSLPIQYDKILERDLGQGCTTFYIHVSCLSDQQFVTGIVQRLKFYNKAQLNLIFFYSSIRVQDEEAISKKFFPAITKNTIIAQTIKGWIAVLVIITVLLWIIALVV